MNLSIQEIEVIYRDKIINHAKYVESISKIYKPAISINWSLLSNNFIQDASAIELNMYFNLMTAASIPIVQEDIISDYYNFKQGNIDILKDMFQLGYNSLISYCSSELLHKITFDRNQTYKMYYNNLKFTDKMEMKRCRGNNKGKMYDSLEVWRLERLADLPYLAEFITYMDVFEKTVVKPKNL